MFPSLGGNHEAYRYVCYEPDNPIVDVTAVGIDVKVVGDTQNLEQKR